ncbi:hypothetical protein N431DRAFT_478580 [Stipitochalara longipes BDJ]|nr:hypothetical protein N431DRAFT_478580 [Stipitochalara longipes BDJ]
MNRNGQEQTAYMSPLAGYPEYYPNYEYSGLADPEDSLLYPILDSLEWPFDNKANDANTNSPLSSPSIHTPQDIGSQDYFNEPFFQALQQNSMIIPSTEILTYSSSWSPQIVPQPEWNPSFTQGNLQPIPSYISLSLIHDPLARENEGENNPAKGSEYSPSSFLASSNDEIDSKRAVKPAWRTTKEVSSRCHSRSGSCSSGQHSSRSKEKEAPNLPSGRSSTSGSSKGHKLRSTRTGHKIHYSEKEEASRREPAKSLKTSHNMVEKQYRTRLNGQFSTLLEALPADLVGPEIEGYGKDNFRGTEKKLSKTDVLVLAKRRIDSLEREKRSLEGRNGELMEDMQRLKGAWVDAGRQLLS